jgi:hypothetical protein
MSRLFELAKAINKTHNEGKVIPMNQPNYDSRLEPKIRERTEEEIEDILIDEYETFLREKVTQGQVWALLTRLNENNQKAAIVELIDRVLEQNGCGKKDKEFMATVDMAAIATEES